MSTSALPVINEEVSSETYNLSLPIAIGEHSSSYKQPVQVTLSLKDTAETDDLGRSIDYSSVHSALVRVSDSAREFTSLDALANYFLAIVFDTSETIQETTIKIVQMLPLPHALVGIQCRRLRTIANGSRRVFINDLVCDTIIGINPQKQPIRLNIFLKDTESSTPKLDFSTWSTRIHDVVVRSSFRTLEALVSFVALESLQLSNNSSDVVTVSATKPKALNAAQSAELEIVRCQNDFPDYFRPSGVGNTSALHSSLQTPAKSAARDAPTAPPAHRPMMSLLSASQQVFSSSNGVHKVMIGLGTNMGDRFANIELALRLLEYPSQFLASRKDAELSIVDTSFMYETAPMYVTDQPMFINCACVAETNLSPRELLTLVKAIEVEVGRVPSIRFGPRAIDLDILTYDSEIIDSRSEQKRNDLDNLEGELLVPHPRMTEREFVLRPIADMMPDYVHPVFGKTVLTILKQFAKSQSPGYSCMRKVIPFPSYLLAGPFPSSHASSTFPYPVPATSTYWKYPLLSTGDMADRSLVHQKTYIMATLNVTPDSFSDGSLHNSHAAAISYATAAVSAGADIIDIGGYSTRPHATYVSVEDEISRVVPIIKSLRELPPTSDAANVRDVLTSVDTFRHEVAREAVFAGVNCINDVYAFSGPGYPLTQQSAEHLLAMRQVARELAVPVVLMHSRGDAGSNKDYGVYGPPGGGTVAGVLEGIRVELGDKVDVIVRGRNGVRRWLVIVDPGVGFSKTVDANLDVIRHASSITAELPLVTAGGQRNALAGYPMLVGASRKSFLEKILERPDPEGRYLGRKTDPKERGWGTAAAIACAVLEDTTAVRVHDVLEMGDVVRIASALRTRG